ncbi:MAG: glycine zipper family protein, partial [Rhizobiaceae bacterium]
AGAALVFTGVAASFVPAEAGPIIRNRVKGAITGAAIGAIVGDPAKGARIGRAVGTVKGVQKRRKNRRARIRRRR